VTPAKRVAIACLVTVLLLGLLLSQIDLRSVVRNLYSLGLAGNLLALALWAATYSLRAHRFSILLSPHSPPFARLLGLTAVYMFALRLLPMRTGEFSYLYLVRSNSSASLAKAGATLAFARVLDMLTVLLLFCAAALLRAKLSFALTLNLALVSVTLVLLLLFMDRLLRETGVLLEWLSRGHRKLPRRLARFAEETAEEVVRLKARRVYLSTFAVTLVIWATTFLTFYVFLRGFGISVSPPAALCGATAAVAASSLPINGIGGFGAVEVGWAAGFIAVGLSKQAAISSGVAMNLTTFVYSALLAGIGLIVMARRNVPGAIGEAASE